MNNITTIYFLRHGQVYNPKNKLYGRLPGYRLSGEGRLMARQAAENLRHAKIQWIYTSPLQRARQTAAIVGRQLNIKPKTSALLLEVKLFCEGISLDTYHHEIQHKLYKAENIRKGQENIPEITNRMLQFVTLMVDKHAGATILSVSHGDPIMILHTATLGIPFTWEYKRDNYLQTGKYLKLQVDEKGYRWSE
jgi:broad specificity phosphatase PhoE